ncbi:MAG: hypothetical protein ABW061_19105 [Polyangiaceae bacterium]
MKTQLSSALLLSLGLLASSEPARASSSWYSAASCRGYQHPLDVVHEDAGKGVATGTVEGVVCPAIRKAGTALCKSEIIVDSGTCSFTVEMPMQDPPYSDYYSDSQLAGSGTPETASGSYSIYAFDPSPYASYGYAYFICTGSVVGYHLVEEAECER